MSLAARASGFEAFDGRVQLHGFYEAQLRALAKGYSADDGWDVAQWYNVLDLELELDLLRDGFGPIDLVSGFVRTDIRYDCVWSGGCGMFPSINTYGNQARRLPKQFSDAQRSGFVGTIRPTLVETGSGARDFSNRRRYIQAPLGQSGSIYAVGPYGRPVPGEGELAHIWNAPGLGELFFAEPGYDPLGHAPDGTPNVDLGRADDDLARYPGSYIAEHFLGYRFGAARVAGTSNGEGTALLGPWRPIDRVLAYGALADRPNPYISVVTTPISIDPQTGLADMIAGVRELAFRPAPAKRFDEPFDIREAQGLYYPTSALKAFLDDGAQIYDQNFSQSDLAWNHGASQGHEQELREAYLDFELFDSRVWMRLGRQVIVWGKTELFRAVDQFNPQDLGLASLPSLEESRIPLWAARMILSIGDVGPVQDLRVEAGVLIDQYEPADLGRCGEPYSPIVTCALSGGLLAHALVGTGLAGEVRPPDPWDDVEGLEGGLRVEWRAGRFSFALSDYYGYDDFPYIDQLNVWERNVDPRSGRPRQAGSRGDCTTGREPACLGVPPTRLLEPGRPLDPVHREDVLYHHYANQQLFATICASTAGILRDAPEACALDIWNNPMVASDIPFAPSFPAAFGTLLAGGKNDRVGQASSLTLFRAIGRYPEMGPIPPMPIVELVRDTDDEPNSLFEINFVGLEPRNEFFLRSSVGYYLNTEQEALLGCGFYYFNPCDITGFDLLNAEASAFYQSWPGFEGTDGNDWDTFVGVQPGTLDFVGGPVCTRYEDGRTYVLPGCVDAPGTPKLNHPFFGPDRICVDYGCTDDQPQFFVSEMAALSFNALMTFVITSSPPDVIDNATGLPEPDAISDRAPYFNEFDNAHPYRLDGCSFRKPFLCGAVAALLGLTGPQRNTVRAGGNASFGRRDFLWHSGAVAGLRRNKRNVLGFAFDFAEDLTKTAWSIELSWLAGVKVADFDEVDGLRSVDQINWVMSVDRSTFINFLNANRTFFFNSQLFLRYIPQYSDSMALNGPVNALATFTVFTGYWQDRLNPSLTLVNDFNSQSGAVLGGVTYRYSERFSLTVGMAVFYGKVEKRPYPRNPIGFANAGAGKGSYRSYVENGLSIVRDRDEVFLRLRYTF